MSLSATCDLGAKMERFAASLGYEDWRACGRLREKWDREHRRDGRAKAYIDHYESSYVHSDQIVQAD